MQKEDMSGEQTRCADSACAAGKRNRFFRGKQMKAEEHTIEQAYGIERRRLLNRAVVGWGVVYGLSLQLEQRKQESGGEGSQSNATRVTRGFALDRHGREIVVEEPLVLSGQNTFVLTRSEHGAQLKSVETLGAGSYVLSVHYAERRMGDAKLVDDCSCEEPPKNFVCETAVFSLELLCGEAGCPCAELECERECACGDCDACAIAGRGPHGQLCRWVRDADAAGAPAPLCRWRDFWLSPSDAVALACVTVAESEDKCAPLAIERIDDDCGPRRIVKSNHLLYDLARGCDLTRISDISWRDWHRQRQPIDWPTFREQFSEDGRTELKISFSRPVLISSFDDTLDVLTITVFTREQSTGWLLPRRIRAFLRAEPDEGPAQHKGTTTGARVYVNKRWYQDEVESDKESWLSENEFSVEVEIRGDLILDCNHQSVDANPRGSSGIPSGNGSPGGTFFSSFRVQPKPCERESVDVEDRQKSRNV